MQFLKWHPIPTKNFSRDEIKNKKSIFIRNSTDNPKFHQRTNRIKICTAIPKTRTPSSKSNNAPRIKNSPIPSAILSYQSVSEAIPQTAFEQESSAENTASTLNKVEMWKPTHYHFVVQRWS